MSELTCKPEELEEDDEEAFPDVWEVPELVVILESVFSFEKTSLIFIVSFCKGLYLYALE